MSTTYNSALIMYKTILQLHASTLLVRSHVLTNFENFEGVVGVLCVALGIIGDLDAILVPLHDTVCWLRHNTRKQHIVTSVF